jgi:hypothetical protein
MNKPARVCTPHNITTIAVIDGRPTACPNRVQGVVSAADWMDIDHPDALEVEFYEAALIEPHPFLICGGVYETRALISALARSEA